jgi:hypothetical protein
MMRSIVTLIGLSLLALNARADDRGAAKEEPSATAPTAECIKLGRGKGLSGAAYDTFLRECITARSKADANPAGIPKNINKSCSG